MQKPDGQDDFAVSRKYMVKSDLKARGICDERILRVMGQIPREIFVPDEYKSQAYSDGPLSIGCYQTISQPYIVALMTQELRVGSDMDVLEIGTGSGYQTAILAKLARRVYTVERFEELSLEARAMLKYLDVNNVEFYIGDGSCGWPQERTFDRIIVTAALPEIPKILYDELVEEGIVVAPVGGPVVQRLVACEKKREKITERFVCDVRFVKVIGEHGFAES